MDENQEKNFAQKYRVLKKIGIGSFGKIYEGEDIETSKKIAIKVENFKISYPQLSFEAKLYSTFIGSCCIPNIYYYGSTSDSNVLVMDLLGQNLESLFNYCHRHFSLKTILMIADQMLTCIQYIHEKNFIHRDLKPENFLIGRNNDSNKIFLIDFGLSQKYRDLNFHYHIPFSSGKNLIGTARYASIPALRGIEQSRRDDLESLGYILIYFFTGNLPWMGLDIKNQKAKNEQICQIKETTPLETLCQGIPKEFSDFISDVRHLRFSDVPDYSKYRQLFRSLFIQNGFIYDYQYDWLIDPQNLTSNDPSKTTITDTVKIPPNNQINKSINKTIKSKSNNNNLNNNNDNINNNNDNLKNNNPDNFISPPSSRRQNPKKRISKSNTTPTLTKTNSSNTNLIPKNDNNNNNYNINKVNETKINTKKPSKKNSEVKRCKRKEKSYSINIPNDPHITKTENEKECEALLEKIDYLLFINKQKENIKKSIKNCSESDD